MATSVQRLQEAHKIQPENLQFLNLMTAITNS